VTVHKKKGKNHHKPAKAHKERAPKVRKPAVGRMLEPEPPRINVVVKPFTKEEVLNFLEKRATDFAKIEKLLDIPVDRLYARVYQFSTAYSAREDADSINLASVLRVADVKLPDASKTVFTIAFVDSGTKTLFLLCDPEKRILVLEPLLYMGNGSWGSVADTLQMALMKKKEEDSKGGKYNFIVGFEGLVFAK
jgi:hypothetical protein